MSRLNPLSAKFKKWSNTLKQFVGKLPTSCVIVFDHFVGLALKELKRGNIGETLVNYWDLLVCQKLIRRRGGSLGG